MTTKNPRAQEMDMGKIEDKLAARRHRLDQALAKIGVTVVDFKESEGRCTLMLRAPAPGDEINAARWRLFIEKSVLFATTAKVWNLDVSKVFFAQNGAVRFLWRLVVTGKDLNSPKRILGEIALETLREGVEVTDVALVGRSSYTYDPSQGKLKGSHSMGLGDQLVGALMSVTSGSGR